MKKWIKRWLGITELEKHNEMLLLRLDLYRTHSSELTNRIQEAVANTDFMKKYAQSSAEKAIDAHNRVVKLADLFVVGVDYSPSQHDKSWAVVCIKGKVERIQFIDVSNKQAQEIQNFLSMFNRENVTVDAGPMSYMFKNN